ncbi:hypothetical protein G7Y89_g6925 [Cudoniella acicularis]|uniref:Uncharacterized protein n=1 Tax=Cudoniella acicularis TaxID=354080 RepID=A0A8H4W519_9HELO|nr:hypothetical protein G7Y89_g6925 [Cudoniella acicularis]
MPHRNNKETIRIIRHTGNGEIPSKKRCQQTKHAACLLEAGIGPAGGGVESQDVGEAEHEEGEPEPEEEGEDDGGVQREEPEEEGEDEPSLEVSQQVVDFRREKGAGKGEWKGKRTCHGVEADGGLELVVFILSGDVETAWSEEDGEGDPETAVRAQSCCSGGVSSSDFP